MPRPLRLVSLMAVLAAMASPASGAPVLRAAEGRIRFASPLACAVDLTLTVEGAATIEHRLELPTGAAVLRLEVDGATVGDTRDIGRTRALSVTPATGATAYTLRYEVRQAEARPHRCPLWLPAVPTDGRSRAVHLAVDVPQGVSVVGGMPAFAWQASHGEATLAHLPAFVIVPFAERGVAPAWDVSRVMDTVAISTLVLASLAWLVRQKGRV